MALPLPPLVGENHHCDDCDYAYAGVSVAAATDLVRGVPEKIRSTTQALSDEYLRARPDGQGWSALEYVCHVRDVYVAYTIRLYRTRVEHTPVLEPMFNDLRAVRFRYNSRDVSPVLDELEDSAAGFLDEVGRNSERTWGRSARRLPGEERSALWLLRQAAHEGIHHTRDINAVLDAVAQARR